MTERKRRPWYSWRRWPGRVLLGLAVVLVGWVIAKEITRLNGERDYRAVVAELDARFPNGWRLEELQAQLPPLPPPAENGALQIAALEQSLRDWPAGKVIDVLWQAEPQTRLSADEVALLRSAVAQGQKEREVLRPFAVPKPGRYPIEYKTKVYKTLLPHLAALQPAAVLMAAEAALRAEDGSRDEAVAAVKVILHTARWVREEPTALAQLCRANALTVAGRTIERLLGQCELTPQQLVELQRLLAEHEAAPYYSTGLRGELAMQDRFYENVANGTLTFEESGPEGGSSSHWQRLQEFPFVRWHLPAKRALTLRFTRLALIATDLPEEEQPEAFRQLEAEIETIKQSGDLIPTLLALRYEKLSVAFHQNHALQRSLIVALAAERFRLAKGRWPDSATELSPDFLDHLPTDPWTGQPLLLRRRPDGLVVYGTGPDREDDQGLLSRDRPTLRDQQVIVGTDAGCQLWDVAKRRQPPLPPKPKSEEEP